MGDVTKIPIVEFGNGKVTKEIKKMKVML